MHHHKGPSEPSVQWFSMSDGIAGVALGKLLMASCAAGRKPGLAGDAWLCRGTLL